jgi:superfamily II DNA or RNA helicase
MTTITLSNYPKGAHVHVQTAAWLAASKGFTACDFTGVVIGGTEKALLIKQDNERAQGWLPFSQTAFTREITTQVVFTPGQDFPDIPNITTTAWAHQKQAYWFAYDKPAAYYALEMGCIDGDALVTANRAGRGFTIPLKQFYYKFHGGESNKRRWDLTLPTYIRGLQEDGTFGRLLVQDILDKGMRATVCITLASGKTLQCTPDHEILSVRDGIQGYRTAESLDTGCMVLTNGKHLDKDGYVRVSNFGHHRETTGGVYEHILVMEKVLGRPINRDEEVHHKNEIKHDNRTENLEVMSKSLHAKRHHWHTHIGDLFIPKEDAVLSVTPAGMRHVYDVVCDPSTARNFVANGMVVHNCGKSLPTVALVINRNHFLSLILCPKSVVDVWADPEEGEFARWSAKPIDVVPLRTGSVTQRVAQASLAVNRARNSGRPLVLVMNYEAAWCSPMGPTYETYIDKNGHERNKIVELGFLMGTGLDCVIADECHRLKSASGKASRFASQLGDRVPYRLALSGTPMPHNPNDLYAQFRFLDKSIFGANFSLFKERYAQYGGYGNVQYLRPRNEEELNEKFYSIAFRVTKDILDLPPFTHQTRFCDLPPKAAKVYEDLEKDFYSRVDSGEITAKNALTVLTRIHQLTGGTLSLDTDDPKEKKLSPIDSGKQDLLADVLDDIADEQVVIFGTYHGDLDTIKAACHAAGRTCAELSGRRNQLHDFQHGLANCIAVQIDSGGAGIDLTKARYCIYYSVGYSLGNYDQSLNRVHRPRQTRHTYFIHLLCKGTIDEIIYKALDKKRRVVEFVMNLHLGKPVYDDAPGQETLL